MLKVYLKKLLKIISIPLSRLTYLPIINIRNWLYDRQLILKTKKLPTIVISVGNLTMGGTGKTPFVIEIAKILQKQGYKPGILTRGYKRKSNDLIIINSIENIPSSELIGDEPLLIAKNTHQMPIGIHRNRFLCGQKLIDNYNCDILIADDCFQHRKLYKDFDIVLWDTSLNPLNEKLFPQGKLREPVNNIKRANILVLISSYIDNKIEETFRSIDESIKIFSAKKIIEKFIKISTGEIIDQKNIENKSILAFCGIGNPHQFFNMLEKTLKPSKIIKKAFPDHHKYSLKDIETLDKIYNKHNIRFIITTEKDLVNIKYYKSITNLLVAKLRLEIPMEFVKYFITQLSLIKSKI